MREHFFWKFDFHPKYFRNDKMSSIAATVSGRKADRARLGLRIAKSGIYAGLALLAYLFKG